MPAFRASSALFRSASALTIAALVGGPALAQQQDPGFFIPGGQRPAQPPQQPRPAQPAQQQRPAQAPARPSTQAPAPLPPRQQPPDAVIGIVDVPEIQGVSTAFNQVRDAIERRR